jgi:SAM-dependent methyltransferase
MTIDHPTRSRVRSALDLPRRIARGLAGGASWQARRQNSAAKVALIAPVLDSLGCRSVLDVGCNAGEVTRLLGRRFFAVGVDKNVDTRGFERPLDGACLGQIEIERESLDRIPPFDAVLLLSVHHQWVAEGGHEAAAERVAAVASRAKKAFFVEFAALNSKYGRPAEDPLFRDNDELTVTAYAAAFLARALPDLEVRLLGSTPESAWETYRYLFVATPKQR